MFTESLPTTCVDWWYIMFLLMSSRFQDFFLTRWWKWEDVSQLSLTIECQTKNFISFDNYDRDCKSTVRYVYTLTLTAVCVLMTLVGPRDVIRCRLLKERNPKARKHSHEIMKWKTRRLGNARVWFVHAWLVSSSGLVPRASWSGAPWSVSLSSP